MEEAVVNSEKTVQNVISLLQRFQDVKINVVSSIDDLINLISENSEFANLSQKELQDLRWFLGEEKAKNQQLENELEEKNQAIHSLEGEIQQLKSSYAESQWYLSEERTRKGQLENSLRGCQQRCDELESQLGQLRGHCEQLQKEIQDAQWYLGEERARRQQLERQINP